MYNNSYMHYTSHKLSPPSRKKSSEFATVILRNMPNVKNMMTDVYRTARIDAVFLC